MWKDIRCGQLTGSGAVQELRVMVVVVVGGQGRRQTGQRLCLLYEKITQLLKGSVSRDFRPLMFFINQLPDS